MNILVVDDSAMIRRIIISGLRKDGYESANMVEAGDGVEALEAVDAYDFDLILSDINMPNMGGLEFVREVRQRPECDGVPIVMVTTETAGSVASDAFVAGATEFIKKPFTVEKLHEILEKIFE